jgi:5-formyltetrahydrofolate cyclo-ligase
LDKQAIRSTLIQRRDALDPDQVASASHTICAQLFAWVDVKTAVIGSYLAVGHEVNLDRLHHAVWAESRACFVPRILSKTTMEWARLESPEDVIQGTYGIPTSVRHETTELDAMDILIMPCAGFDRRLHRLGMGGGFYDRALSQTPSPPFKIGVAFSQQEWPAIPVEAWDQPFDVVITEREVIHR